MLHLPNRKFLKVPHIPTTRIFHEIGKNPFVDWILVLTAGLIVTILLIANGVSLYKEIKNGNTEKNNQAQISSKKSFDQKSLSDIIETFKLKESAFIKAKSGYNGASDPSI